MFLDLAFQLRRHLEVGGVDVTALASLNHIGDAEVMLHFPLHLRRKEHQALPAAGIGEFVGALGREPADTRHGRASSRLFQSVTRRNEE